MAISPQHTQNPDPQTDPKAMEHIGSWVIADQRYSAAEPGTFERSRQRDRRDAAGILLCDRLRTLGLESPDFERHCEELERAARERLGYAPHSS